MTNSIASACIKVMSLACSLVIVPITIDYLNPENYGIWMALTSVLYWLTFMDIGLGNGMRNYMADALAKNDFQKARSYFSTAIVFLSLIALLLAFISLSCIQLLDLNKLFNTNSVTAGELMRVMTVAVTFSLIQFVVKNIGMVYVAMQKYAVNDLINFLGNFFSLVIIYILTLTTKGNLTYVVLVFTAMPVLMFTFAAIPLMKKYPQLLPSIKCIELESAKKIVSKGLGFFAIQITSCLVIFGSSNMIISHYCGPEQVTVYNISYKLFNVLVIAMNIIIAPLWNAYTDAAAKGDYKWIQTSYMRSLKIWGVSLFAGIVLLLISEWLFKIWVGDSVSVPFSVSLCVLLYISMFNLNSCATYLLNGLNKIRVQIITSVAATVLYLIVIMLFKDRYGVEGISLTMSAAYFIMAMTHLYQSRMLIKGTAKGIWNK